MTEEENKAQPDAKEIGRAFDAYSSFIRRNREHDILTGIQDSLNKLQEESLRAAAKAYNDTPLGYTPPAEGMVVFGEQGTKLMERVQQESTFLQKQKQKSPEEVEVVPGGDSKFQRLVKICKVVLKHSKNTLLYGDRYALGDRWANYEMATALSEGDVSSVFLLNLEKYAGIVNLGQRVEILMEMNEGLQRKDAMAFMEISSPLPLTPPSIIVQAAEEPGPTAPSKKLYNSTVRKFEDLIATQPELFGSYTPPGDDAGIATVLKSIDKGLRKYLEKEGLTLPTTDRANEPHYEGELTTAQSKIAQKGGTTEITLDELLADVEKTQRVREELERTLQEGGDLQTRMDNAISRLSSEIELTSLEQQIARALAEPDSGPPLTIEGGRKKPAKGVTSGTNRNPGNGR